MEQLLNAEFLLKASALAQTIFMVVGAITVLATVVVKLTPTKTDDQMVSKFGKGFVKVMQWLPTIGINPHTKKLEETIMELRESTNSGVVVSESKPNS